MTQGEILSKQLAASYNCAHFAADVWEHETGRDIRSLLIGFLVPRKGRVASMQLRGDFERIQSAASPCIVLFRRPRSCPHVGVFLRGRVIHLTKSGVIRQSLETASLGYTSVRYYAVRPDHN